MSTITPLPPSTISALGSGQTLTDPISLLKELIENSLDAQATQISVECTSNLLDTLVVKDNGVGILPADRSAAAKCHYTSKIADFSDIASVATLGFRGEALASAAELSEKFSFTTRCQGEVVAEVYEIARNGEVRERKAIGAPLGTTVKVEGFLKRIPVRRENVVRNQKAMMARLRRLMVTYYLSRPRCRLALKVLKGGETVVYAPSTSVAEAVRKAVGKDAAGVCEWREMEKGSIFVDAFLATREADVRLLERSMCEGYVYVDNRPVSCDKRGSTIQKVWKMYKECIKGIAGDAKAPSNPLLYLNIRCPKGIYDANVEPAKDDVLFDGLKANQVLEAVEELFKDVYGELPVFQERKEREAKKKKEVQTVDTADFDVLLARRKEPMIQDVPSPPPPPEEEPDDLMEPLDEAAIEAEKGQVRNDITLSNPWTISKMNAPSSPTHRRSPDRVANSSPTRSQNTSSLPPHISNPIFTPINPLHPRGDDENSPHTPALRKKGYGFPPTPFSPPRQQQIVQFPSPRSGEHSQQPTLLHDPENAGAIDRFIVRTPRSPEVRRPIPREFDTMEDRPGINPMEDRPGINPTTHIRGPSTHNDPTEELPGDDDLTPRTSIRRTRPGGEGTSHTSRRRLRKLSPELGVAPTHSLGFISAADVYSEVGSQQFDVDDDPACKKRRLHPNSDSSDNNPNRNRYLAATAELSSPSSPPRAPRQRSPRFLIPQEPERPYRRRRVRTLTVPPLLPFDEDFQTHKATLTARSTVQVHGNEGILDGEITKDWLEREKDAVGEVVRRWVQVLTGVEEEEEEVCGWRLEGREGEVRVLRAVGVEGV